MAKTTEAEKQARREAIQAAMIEATEVPLETMRVCQQALSGAVVVARAGNPNAKSDVGVGIEFLLTGLRGGRMNVDINVASLSDAAYVKRVTTERDVLIADGEADADRARKALA
jgi:formiminotetrahydrofolate cyclodeaminase